MKLKLLMMKNFNELSIADLKAALDYTKDQIKVFESVGVKFGYSYEQEQTVKYLNETVERLEIVLFSRIKDLKNYE